MPKRDVVYTLLLFFMIRLFIFVVQHFQHSRTSKRRLSVAASSGFYYDRYWCYAVDRRLFKKLIARFENEAFPLLQRKIESELGNENWRIIDPHTKASWFEFWLAHTHPQRLYLNNNHCYLYFSLFACCELPLLQQLEWREVVRNVPAVCWKNSRFIYAPVLLHLGRGINIRRYPAYSFYSRRMAHLFHRTGNKIYLPYGGEAHLLLLTLGYDGLDDWSLRMLVHQLIHGTEGDDRIKRLTPFVQRLIRFRKEGLLNNANLEKIAFYSKDHWPAKAKAIMKLKNFGQLERAADRYLNTLAEQQRTEELMAEYGYQSDQHWDSGPPVNWNRCTNEGWYRIVALSSATDLVEEGARMHHCVGGYVEECVSDESRIFSLRRRAHRKTKWRSVVTIEIKGQRVANALGVLNTDVSTEHRSLLDQWFRSERIMIDWNELDE